MSAPSPSSSGGAGPGGKTLEHCDNVCRLLTPPQGAGAASGRLALRALVPTLGAVDEGFGKAVAAWSQYQLTLNGASYKTALRVAGVVLGTAYHAVRACCDYLAMINGDADEDAMSASFEDDEANGAAVAGIRAHGTALLASVNRARLHALNGPAEHLRSALDTCEVLSRKVILRSACEVMLRRVRATWPLRRAVVDMQRAMSLDTFKVPPSVHEVLGVLEEVGKTLRGKEADAATKSEEPPEDEDPAAAMRREFLASLAENAAASPAPPPPYGKGFVGLLSLEADLPDSHDLPKCWITVRNALAADSNSPPMPTCPPPAPWSPVMTVRDDPGGVSAGLSGPQESLFAAATNHLHSAVGRYPDNMTAFYAMAVLLADTLCFLEPFVVPITQLPTVQRRTAAERSLPTSPSLAAEDPSTSSGVQQRPSSTPSLYGRHRCIPVVQPSRSGATAPDCALYSVNTLQTLVGIGLDKLCTEVDRIIREAKDKFEPLPSSAPESQPSGALLTVLSSAAQPLVAVLTKYRLDDVPSVMHLASQVLSRVVCRFDAEWTLLSRRHAGGRVTATNDLALFRRFFDNHESLSTEFGAKLKAAVYENANWTT